MADKTPYDRRSPMEHERDEATPLRKLIEAVEAGTYDKFLFDALEEPENYTNAIKAYHGSLDAAKALHESLLPGYGAEIYVTPKSSTTYGDCRVDDWASEYDEYNYNDKPARVWLICILRAYEAQP